MPLSRRALLGNLAASLSLPSAGIVFAADPPWPARTVKLVSPFNPGGAIDVLNRLIAEKLATRLGQQVIVEAIPGANTIKGADAVAKAAPDGYTILVGTNSTNAALKFLMKQLPYNQDTAFVPAGYIGSVPLMVAVNNDVPAKTLKEFVDLAKAKATYENVCSQCHELSDVDADPPRSRREAERLVRRMIAENDAEMSAAEVRLVVAYLEAKFARK